MTKRGQIAPLALTAGELGGVGPYLTATIWQARAQNHVPVFFYLGPTDAFKAHGVDIPIEVITDPAEALDVFDHALPLLDIEGLCEITVGALNPDNAKCVIASIEKATELARTGKAAAVVTNPIHKATLYGEGFAHQGHTDFLAHLCGMGETDSVMMLTTEGLRVIPITVHVPLAEVPKQLTTEAIIKTAVIAAEDLKKHFNLDNPRIAVTGLNPHAGEDGTIGLEEGTHIIPAIRQLRDMGYDISGPHAADTLFHAEAREKYDVALCMYHDQALVPIKTLDFYGGVNVTLGLPIIRTSPDHGTALERAKSGDARPDSLLAALKLAHEMASNA